VPSALTLPEVTSAGSWGANTQFQNGVWHDRTHPQCAMGWY